MSKAVFFIFAFFSVMSYASVGVTTGHHTINKKDGLPEIGRNEQVSVFICKGKMSSLEAAQCSLRKCMKAFGVPADSKSVKYGNNDVFGGKCVIDGYTNRRGHSLIMVGPKGDNQMILSKSLGSLTRETAMIDLNANNFPVSKGTMVFDYWDNDGY